VRPRGNAHDGLLQGEQGRASRPDPARTHDYQRGWDRGTHETGKSEGRQEVRNGDGHKERIAMPESHTDNHEPECRDHQDRCAGLRRGRAWVTPAVEEKVASLADGREERKGETLRTNDETTCADRRPSHDEGHAGDGDTEPAACARSETLAHQDGAGERDQSRVRVEHEQCDRN
jgi:hypothetical protein